MHPCVIVINCPRSAHTSCKALQDEDWSYLVMFCVQVAATFVFHHVCAWYATSLWMLSLCLHPQVFVRKAHGYILLVGIIWNNLIWDDFCTYLDPYFHWSTYTIIIETRFHKGRWLLLWGVGSSVWCREELWHGEDNKASLIGFIVVCLWRCVWFI